MTEGQRTGRARIAIILAAGKSTRMKSNRSKVLHKVGGRPMLDWVAGLARQAGAERIIAVVGEINTDVRAEAEALGLEIAIQEPQLGTAHAVLAARDHVAGFEGDVIILYADTPLIKPETLGGVFACLETGADLVVLGFESRHPFGYGRLIEGKGELLKIVEQKDASPEELKVNLCNSGVMAGKCAAMFRALEKVGNDNAQGEYYLTDIVEILRKDKATVKVARAGEDEIQGVNSRADLAIAEAFFQKQQRQHFLEKGVTLRDPDAVWFSWDTEIEADVTIGQNVVFGPGVKVESGAVIHPFCHIEGAHIRKNTQIGPFARLRPGAVLEEGAKAGNFVEIKKSTIGKGSKINHLSYIGDAEVGAGVNVGAGTITCNYDGFNKHKTVIGDGAFVGTNSSLVAPVTIGKGAFLGSGGVITEDVPENALALGRAKQTNKPGWAARFRAAMAKRKSKET